MLDEIKKGIFTGLGSILLTKEKVEEVVKKLVDESKINKDDAKKLAEDLARAGKDQWSEIEESLSGALKKAVKSLNIAKQDEMEEMKTEIDNLKKKISKLEDRLKPSKE